MKEVSIDPTKPQRRKKIVLRKLHWRHLHGIGGAVFLLACISEVVLFVVRGRPTFALTAVIGVSSLPFGLGLFTRSFRRRLVRLGHRKFIFFRATAWIYAFYGLACSVYAQPLFQLEQAVSMRWGFTVVFAVFSVASIAIAVYELARMTLFTDGFIIANVTSIAMLVAMPLLHVWFGAEVLAGWYERYPVGHTVYFLCIYTGLIAAYATFVRGLVTNRRAYYEQYKKSSAILWGGCYMVGSVLALGLMINWLTGLAYFVVVSIVFALSSRMRFPIEENQQGLLGRD